jgi:hypothetical protein
MARKKTRRSSPRKSSPMRKNTKTKTRRRRRLSAGAGAFKAVSDPIFGSIIGAVAGSIAGSMVKKATNNETFGAAAPILVGFLIKKKAPYVAGGMVAAPALSFLANWKKQDGSKMLPFLSEEGNVSFADELLLSEAVQPLILSEQGYSLNEDGLEENDFTLSEDMLEEDDM